MAAGTLPVSPAASERAVAQALSAFPAAVRDLSRFVAIPSVSAEPRHRGDVREAGRWLAQRLRRAGVGDARVVRVAGQEVVVGRWLRRGAPAIVIYGHYDVVPAPATQHWRAHPFQPRIVGAHLYGRGASDDKGPILAHVTAAESCLRADGGMPLSVHYLFESGEEVGSTALRAAVEELLGGRGCRLAVVSDTRMIGPRRPAIVSSTRGSLGMTLSVRRTGGELHDGAWGGVVPDPAAAICRALAAATGRRGAGAPGLRVGARPAGDPARLPAELRPMLHPSIAVTALAAGDPGNPARSAITDHARAGVQIRLVPGQSPESVRRALLTLLSAQLDPGLQLSARTVKVVPPGRAPLTRDVTAALRRALAAAFGSPPMIVPSGGTVPAVRVFREVLGIDTALVGLSLPTDGIHGPNERYHLPTMRRAIDAATRMLFELAGVTRWRS